MLFPSKKDAVGSGPATRSAEAEAGGKPRPMGEDERLPAYHASQADDVSAGPSERATSAAARDQDQVQGDVQEKDKAWSGPPISLGISDRYLHSDTVSLAFRPTKSPLSKGKWTAHEKQSNQLLFTMRSPGTAETFAARKSLSKLLGYAASDEQANVLRKTTFVVESSAGEALLYLHRIGQLGTPTPKAWLRVYDAYLPGALAPRFHITMPDPDNPNRKPHMYLTLPLGDASEKDTENREIRIKLVNIESEGRWAMHERQTKHWVAQCWPVQSAMLSRIPFVGHDTLTLRAAPHTDLLLLATVAFTKLEADAEIRDSLRLQASTTDVGFVGM